MKMTEEQEKDLVWDILKSNPNKKYFTSLSKFNKALNGVDIGQPIHLMQGDSFEVNLDYKTIVYNCTIGAVTIK